VGAPTSADNAFGTTQLSAPVDDDPFASAFSGLSEAKEEDPNVTAGGDFETTDNFDEFDSPFGSFPNASHNGSVFAQQTVVKPSTQPSPFAVAPTSIPTNNDEWDELFADFPSGPTDSATTASNADINDAFSAQRVPATKPQSPKSSAVADLVGMGFSHADALDALQKKNFNVADATNYLLDK
jgi:epidermal growth factor receptor substrate 15